MDYRDVLQRKFLKLTTTENYEKYKRQRKKVNNLIKRAEQNYNKNLLDEKHWNKHWRTLKSTFPTKPKSKLISTTFKVNEEEIWSEETIANEFGQFFSSIATTLLQTQHPIEDFVWNKPKNLLIRTTQKLSFPSVTRSEICKCLKKSRGKKAHGIDELPPNLFKDVANEVSKPMVFIINKSLSSGKVPGPWKISKVTPLYKSDSKSYFSNYRPVSVLPCLSKVLEQVVHCQLSNYLEKHYLLKSTQFGFLPRRSTELACNLLVDDIRKNIDNGLLTGAIYLDLSKAFVTVSYSYLLSKLPSYGKNGNEFTSFEHYLFNRKQHIFCNAHLSKAFPVFRGVQQGSILKHTPSGRYW